MSEDPAKHEVEPLPCPFCGGTDLLENTWCMDDEEGPFTEVEAWECNTCQGSAPKRSWNKRPDPWINYEDQDPPNGVEVLWSSKTELSKYHHLHTYDDRDGKRSIPAWGTHWRYIDHPEES